MILAERNLAFHQGYSISSSRIGAPYPVLIPLHSTDRVSEITGRDHIVCWSCRAWLCHQYQPQDSSKPTGGAQYSPASSRFLVYAQIFDFVACSPVERIGLVNKQLTCVTSVGVQVRIANAATGEYIPGSTDPLSREGKYVHTVNLSLFGDNRLAFDQSAVGKATLNATQHSVRKALERFDRAGW